jgi:hypothetical protein
MRPIRLSAVPRHRLLGVALGLIALFMAAVGPAMAAGPSSGIEPIDLRDAAPLPTPRPAIVRAPSPTPSASPTPSPSPTPSASPTATPTPSPTPTADPIGYDVSYPQCGSDLPTDFSFAIVGVNGGRVYSSNPCLGAGEPGEDASQLEWAGREAQLYANTGNPGPRISRYWPDGHLEPRECDMTTLRGGDTVDCAYVYGWNAAADSYRTALEAFVALEWADADADRLPWATNWWLDVEVANSWRAERPLNVATLEGARDYLESMEVEQVGFYSTPRMWHRITGGTDAFADHPAWHAGARDLDDAKSRCEDEPAFTGGELEMVQWVEDGLDHNIRCP